MTETYLKAVALKRMPPNLQTVDMLKAGISLTHARMTRALNTAVGMRRQMVTFALTFPLTVTLNPHVFSCNRSARALLGLLCVPAGEGEAGEHLGGA